MAGQGGNQIEMISRLKKKRIKKQNAQDEVEPDPYIYIFDNYIYICIHLYICTIIIYISLGPSFGCFLPRHPSPAKVLPSRLLPLPMTLVTWVVATSSSWSAFGWKIRRVAWKLRRNA